MKQLLNNKLVIIGTILLLVLIILVIVITKIGSVYKSGLQNADTNTQATVSITKTNKIRKLTLKNKDNSCIEVGPDGKVRIFANCDDKLTNAGRTTDQSQISKLFKFVSEADLFKYKTRKNITDYELIIDTDDGTIYIYIPNNSQDPITTIIDIIDDVADDVNQSSPLPSNTTNPGASGFVYSSPTSSGGDNDSSPYPDASNIIIDKPFICGFLDQNNKKPLNVSNIICSTNPSPAP